jgi:hypothetical protein
MFDLKTLVIAVGAALLGGAAVGGWLAWDIRSTRADVQLLKLTATYQVATAAAKEQSLVVERDLQVQINTLSQKGRDKDHEIDNHAAAVADSTGGLLQAAASSFSAATCDPGVARRGAAATRAAALYSELLGESQLLAKGLAEEADRARSAGASCEVAYDLVRKGIGGLAKGPAVTGG